MALTKPQRARLEKLATYLEGLPEDYTHFHMGAWVDTGDAEAELHYARKNGGVASCGTSACAAGHGPAAGILVPPRYIAKDGSVLWVRYCDMFVGSSGSASDWCFDGGWSRTDNHHWGAAARIRYLLDHGQPPDAFYCPSAAHLPAYAPYRIDAKAPANV